MPNLHDISEGYTKDFLIHGVFAIIIGATLFIVHWLWTVLFVLIAIACFCIRSGIDIDVPGRRARVYKALGRWKVGMYKKLQNCTGIELRYTNEAQVMSSRGSSTNVVNRTYDLVFIFSDRKELMFHDFTDYQKARKATDIMVKNWSLSFTDEVQLIKHRVQENSVRRRR